MWHTCTFPGSPVDSDQHLLLVPLCEKYWSLCVGVILFSMIKKWSEVNKGLPDILRLIHWYYCHAFYCYYEQKDLKFKFLCLAHSWKTHKKKLILIKCFKYGDVKKRFRSSVLKSWKMHFEFCSLKKQHKAIFFFLHISKVFQHSWIMLILGLGSVCWCWISPDWCWCGDSRQTVTCDTLMCFWCFS